MKEIKISVKIPDNISRALEREASQKGLESAVLTLWQKGSLSIREAAKALNITYYDFIELLKDRSIPIETEDIDQAKIKQISKSLKP